MRIAKLLLLLPFFSQGVADADVLSSLTPESRALLKQCPSALKDLNTQAENSEKALKEAPLLQSKDDKRVILCQAVKALADDTAKFLSDLRACQSQGLIDAQAFIDRETKVYADMRSTEEMLNSMQKVCPHQP